MIRTRINRYELFVRVLMHKYSNTKTTIKIWVEAENHYSAKLQAESLYGRNNVVSAPMLVRN
jgi:hypothetical protein